MLSGWTAVERRFGRASGTADDRFGGSGWIQLGSVPRLFEQPLARSLLGLAVVMALGVVGYMVIEGWSLLDASYMVVLTFTTVGYQEVNRLSAAGRVFTMFVMVGGVGMMLYVFTSVLNILVAQEIVGSLVRRHRMRVRTRKLNGHFIVCGYGRVGRAVATALHESSLRLIVMDKDAEVLAEAETQGLLYFEGDSTRDDDLRAVQVESAAGLVAATGDDGVNVYISLTARGLNPDLHIVARASRSEAEQKLRMAGADRVISPHIIGGRQMAQMAMEGIPP